MNVRAGALGFDHTLRDDRAHLRHGNKFARLGLRSSWLRSSWGRGGGWCCNRRSGDRLWTLLEVTYDVGLGDSPRCSGAGNLGEIDVVVFCDLANERR